MLKPKAGKEVVPVVEVSGRSATRSLKPNGRFPASDSELCSSAFHIWIGRPLAPAEGGGTDAEGRSRAGFDVSDFFELPLASVPGRIFHISDPFYPTAHCTHSTPVLAFPYQPTSACYLASIIDEQTACLGRTAN